jgi:hypothetical protein
LATVALRGRSSLATILLALPCLLVTTLTALAAALTITAAALATTLPALLPGRGILGDRDDDLAQQGDGSGQRDGAQSDDGHAGHGLDPRVEGTELRWSVQEGLPPRGLGRNGRMAEARRFFARKGWSDASQRGRSDRPAASSAANRGGASPPERAHGAL